MIIKDVKIILNFIKKDPDYKSKIKKEIDNQIAEYGDESMKDEINEYKLICDVEKDSNSLLITIIDGHQETRIALSFILTDVCRLIRMKYKNIFKSFDLSIDTGDGDEGSIYISKSKK